MRISLRDVRGVTILDLQGRFVMEDGVAQFVEQMNRLIHQARRGILLNFDQVTYLDSAGVGAIAWKYVTARKRDVDVKLLNLRRKSYKVLDTTRLLTIFESFESEDAAIDSFAGNEDDNDAEVCAGGPRVEGGVDDGGADGFGAVDEAGGGCGCRVAVAPPQTGWAAHVSLLLLAVIRRFHRRVQTDPIRPLP